MLKAFYRKNKTRISIYFILFFVIFTYWYYLFRTAPDDFPVGKNFLVQEDESLKSISNRLESENIISSALLFRAWVSAYNKDRKVNAGQYVFSKPIVLGAVVKKLVGIADKPLIQITIPEGSTNEEIASIINVAIPEISKSDLLLEIKNQNVSGKLFPETYFLLPSQNKEKIIDILFNTFTKKYNEYISTNQNFVKSTLSKMQDIGYDKKNLDNGVVILASIIQGEGKSANDMKIISGILWKRLLTNMALQVDVAKETYTKRGLPSAPINNPGMDAIEAVFNPTVSEYLYYITGKDGKMYYAKTFTEHKKNIAKYLK